MVSATYCKKISYFEMILILKNTNQKGGGGLLYIAYVFEVVV